MIGIIGAMEEEVAILKAAMTDVRVREKATMQFQVGNLRGREAVVVRSGIGKVNAGICAQILIDDFQVECLINTGIAGSLDNRIEIGDMVISTDAVHHDMDATLFGDPVGQVPRLDTLSFPADARLRLLAKELNAQVNPEIQTFMGRVASGDQFISAAAVKTEIVRRFRPLCVEMEGAAIAQTAYLNHVPYLIIRAISDKADDSAHMDYPEFEQQAISHSTRLLLALAAAL